MSIQELFPYMLTGAGMAAVISFVSGFVKAAVDDLLGNR